MTSGCPDDLCRDVGNHDVDNGLDMLAHRGFGARRWARDTKVKASRWLLLRRWSWCTSSRTSRWSRTRQCPAPGRTIKTSIRTAQSSTEPGAPGPLMAARWPQVDSDAQFGHGRGCGPAGSDDDLDHSESFGRPNDSGPHAGVESGRAGPAGPRSAAALAVDLRLGRVRRAGTDRAPRSESPSR